MHGQYTFMSEGSYLIEVLLVPDQFSATAPEQVDILALFDVENLEAQRGLGSAPGTAARFLRWLW